ncbi:hypothetical protein GYB22_09910 [bacterium]|nr:hypothetical protein [bacterium]
MRILTIILLMICGVVYAQDYTPPPHLSVKVLASTTSFLSDLGGKNAKGSNDFLDMDLSQTRVAFGAGMQYNHGFVGLGVNCFYARLSADDRLTSEEFRAARRISVRTDIIEANFMLELTVPQQIPIIGDIYANIGYGVVYFEPKAEYNGVMYKLRPFGTEGQNYLPNKDPYGHFAPVLPFGFGKKFLLENGSKLSLDIMFRKSFTDYLDDVSTTYADVELIREMDGDVAAHFANPGFEDRRPGSGRGNPNNFDSYFLIGFRYEIPLIALSNRNGNTTCIYSGQGWFGNSGKMPVFRKGGKTRRKIFR